MVNVWAIYYKCLTIRPPKRSVDNREPIVEQSGRFHLHWDGNRDGNSQLSMNENEKHCNTKVSKGVRGMTSILVKKNYEAVYPADHDFKIKMFRDDGLGRFVAACNFSIIYMGLHIQRDTFTAAYSKQMLPFGPFGFAEWVLTIVRCNTTNGRVHVYIR